jgi:Ca2+-binding RTX toxin-like protein
MRIRAIFVSVATAGLMVGPAFAHGIMSSIAGAKAECTITGTAANDDLNGTTRDDVICLKAGQDEADGLEGNDIIRGGQGDDGGGAPPGGICGVRGARHVQPDCKGTIVHDTPGYVGLRGGDGSDVIKGQADDDSLEGNGQNDKLYGGQGADCLGANCTSQAQQYSEEGNDFLTSRDGVSGNDFVDGGDNTDTCVVDAGDEVHSCEL